MTKSAYSWPWAEQQHLVDVVQRIPGRSSLAAWSPFAFRGLNHVKRTDFVCRASDTVLSMVYERVGPRKYAAPTPCRILLLVRCCCRPIWRAAQAHLAMTHAVLTRGSPNILCTCYVLRTSEKPTPTLAVVRCEILLSSSFAASSDFQPCDPITKSSRGFGLSSMASMTFHGREA
jgi:hypothetical protein